MSEARLQRVDALDLIVDDDFRKSLQDDHRELRIAVENRCWKAARVLAGSIIEAIPVL
ncbi:MAG: hypothetical protein ACP5R5_05745 [Armatimonadota bacterium]